MLENDEVKYKVKVTILDLPENEDEYELKVNELELLLQENGFRYNLGFGEVDV